MVGMCAHRLAVARSLGRRSVQVHALEANDGLPGTTTRQTALVASSAANALDIDGRRLDSPSRTDIAPAEDGVKRKFEQ